MLRPLRPLPSMSIPIHEIAPSFGYMYATFSFFAFIAA